MEARPEEKPDMMDDSYVGAATKLADVSAMPEARLSDRLSQLPDDELPDFINPNNSDMPSDDGKLALECLRALGTAGLSEDRKTQIVEALTLVTERKVGKKVLKSLIGMEKPEDRKLAASGFNTVKTSIASSSAENEAAVDKTPQQVKKDRRHIKHDPTQKSLKILGNIKSREAQRERALQNLLRPRMMLPPEEFFDNEDIYDAIRQIMEAGEPNIAQVHYDLRAPILNGHRRFELGAVESLIDAWGNSGDKEAESYEHPLIAKLQMSFLTQMKFLTIPDHGDAARFAKDEIKEAMLLLHDSESPTMRLNHIKTLVDRAAGKALSFSAFPKGLTNDVAARTEKRLSIVRMPEQVVGKEQKPMSSLERIVFLLTAAYDRIEKIEQQKTSIQN